MCDDFNQCGDNSDESQCTGVYWWMVGVKTLACGSKYTVVYLCMAPGYMTAISNTEAFIRSMHLRYSTVLDNPDVLLSGRPAGLQTMSFYYSLGTNELVVLTVLLRKATSPMG